MPKAITSINNWAPMFKRWQTDLSHRIIVVQQRIDHLQKLGFTQKRRLNRQREITVKEELLKLHQYIIINKLGGEDKPNI
jgi:hypothetical protein